jgi:hypothetical protein
MKCECRCWVVLNHLSTEDLLLDGYTDGLQKTCDAVTVAVASLESDREEFRCQTYYSARNLTSSMGALERVRLLLLGVHLMRHDLQVVKETMDLW